MISYKTTTRTIKKEKKKTKKKNNQATKRASCMCMSMSEPHGLSLNTIQGGRGAGAGDRHATNMVNRGATYKVMQNFKEKGVWDSIQNIISRQQFLSPLATPMCRWHVDIWTRPKPRQGSVWFSPCPAEGARQHLLFAWMVCTFPQSCTVLYFFLSKGGKKASMVQYMVS